MESPPDRNYEPTTDDDPAMQAVNEAGGGVAEGFEQAEQELVDNAESQGDASALPRTLGEDPPEEEGPVGEYGEGDEVHSTEVLSDPAEGPDDPGAGPRLTEER